MNIPKKKVVIDYLRVHTQIPRDEKNDPHFQELHSILSVFTPEEVVAIVNRYLYQIEYQRTWHREWERERSEQMKEVKRKMREMFKTTWAKATPSQIEAAVQALKGEKK